MAICFVLFGVDLDFFGLLDGTSPETEGGDHENGRHKQPVKLSACVAVKGAGYDCQPVRQLALSVVNPLTLC
jgi:hypothetical protein